MKKLLFVSFTLLLSSFLVKAQVTPCNCTANVGSGNVNFSTLSWSGSGCPTAGSTSYSGNLCVTLDNAANLIMDKTNFTISGGFGMSNNGNSTFTLPAGNRLTVGGNLGDDSNNNVTFVINGDLTVSGTIYGKNSNAFSGSGSVTATGLDFNQAPTCSPCNIDWNVSSCQPASPFCTMVLPVTLISFEVDVQTDHIALNWATATELNFDRFIIEKTTDGKTFFEIGSLPGAGFSSIRRDYAFKDTAPIIGRSYYRLKALDIDGYTEYFGLVVADYAGQKSITLYPNPTQSNSITVLTNFEPAAEDKVEIFDNLGIKLMEISMSGFEENIDFKNRLGQGSYLLRYASTNYNQVIRFTVR